MKRVEVTVAYRNEPFQREQQGWATDVPGLVATKSEVTGSWVVVHEPSGLTTYVRRTRKEAVAAAEAIASVTDWTRELDMKDLAEIATQCRAALEGADHNE